MPVHTAASRKRAKTAKKKATKAKKTARNAGGVRRKRTRKSSNGKIKQG